MTVQQAIYEFAPPTENDTENYLAFVCKGLGCTPGTLMSDALAIPAT